MNRPVPRALSRAALIIAAILVAYFIFSFLSLGIRSSDWILILLTVVIILAFAIPFLDKAFGDKLPFLSQWPTRPINARIRRILGFRFLGGGNSFNNAQTGKQVAVNTLWASSLFIIILAIVSIRLLLGRPVSDALANLLGTAFMGSCSLAVLQFLAIRLNMKYDLKSALLAIIIYVPIIMVAFSITLVWFGIIDDGTFRIERFLFLSMCCFIIIITTLITLLHGIRKPAAPTPAFTTHPLYRRAEVAVSVVSFFAVAILFMLSS